MRVTIVAALCALALARIPSSQWERENLSSGEIREDVFGSGKEFQYSYEGQLCSGIPGSSKQHSATRIQARLVIVMKGDDQCLLQIKEVRMGKLNRDVPKPKEMLPFMAFEQVTIDGQEEQKLKLPVKFYYRNGMIRDVVFDGQEQAWSANIKRGILNSLQINLSRQGSTQLGDNDSQQTTGHFTTVEDTIEGRCESVYTVTKKEEGTLDSGDDYQGGKLRVTKSINFDRCQKRPQIKYNWRFQDDCPTCQGKYSEDGKFLKSSTVSNFVIRGGMRQYLIEKVSVNSQYEVVPFNRQGNLITTYVRQELKLLGSGSIESDVQQPRNQIQSDTDLVYSLDWDMDKEDFYMDGESDFHKNTPFGEIRNKQQFVSRLIRSLLSEMRESVSHHAPRYYVRLVKFFRMLKRTDIENIHDRFVDGTPENFTPEDHQKIKSILVDVLADTCTKDSIDHLVSKIQNGRIRPTQGGKAIKGLINCRVVSKGMINKLMSLAESNVCKENFFLKQSVYLTMGSMVNALCQQNDDLLAQEYKKQSEYFCSTQFKEELTQKLFGKFQRWSKWEDKVLSLKTIANMGLGCSIPQLKKIIRCNQQDQEQFSGCTEMPMRSEAVLALRHIRKNHPKQVRDICMPIFMNGGQPTDLRITCAYQIFQTLPSRPVLDQMVRKLYTERNRQVASFVYTYMQEHANSTNPCLKKFGDDLKLSLRNGKHISYAYNGGYSRYYHGNLDSKKYGLGLGVNVGSVFGRTQNTPQVVAMGINTRLLGFWGKNFMTVIVRSSGVDNFVDTLLGNRGYLTEGFQDLLSDRSPRSSSTRNPGSQLKSIFSKLGIQGRGGQDSDPRGYMSLLYKNMEYNFIPFKMDTISQMVNDYTDGQGFSLANILTKLQNGMTFNVYSGSLFNELSYKVPTTLGMPLVVSLKMPTVSSITGQLRLDVNTKQLQLREFNANVAHTTVFTVKSWNPVVSSGIKVLVQGRINTPGGLTVQQEGSTGGIKIEWSPSSQPTKWISLKTQPITFTRVWPKQITTWVEPQEKTVIGDGEEWNRIYNVDQQLPIVRKIEQFCRDYLDMDTDIQGTWHRSPSMRLGNTNFCPLSGANKLTVSSTNGPDKIVFKSHFEQFLSHSQDDISWDLEGRKGSEGESLKTQMHWQLYTVKGGRQHIKVKGDSQITCGPQMQYCKYLGQLQQFQSGSLEPLKVCVDGQLLYPEIPYNFRQLQGKQVKGNLKVTWGEDSCQEGNNLQLRLTGEQSDEQKDFTQRLIDTEYSEDICSQQPEKCSPVGIYYSLQGAANLLQYTVQCQWNNLPEKVKDVGRWFLRTLKSYYYWQSNVDYTGNGQGNKMTGKVVIDPTNPKYVTAFVRSPQENVVFSDIVLPEKLQGLNIRKRSWRMRGFQDLIRQGISSSYSDGPICRLFTSTNTGTNRIQTFDGVKYQLPLTTCYSVLAKDCRNPDQPTFAVLIKNIGGQGDSTLKKMKILCQSHEIELIKDQDCQDGEGQGCIRVRLNGQGLTQGEQEKTLTHHGHQVVKIEKFGPYVTVRLLESGVRVYFDGYSANIKVGHMLRNYQCGLCGHYDGEMDGEFRQPDGTHTTDVRSFYQKYTLKDGQCDYPQQLDQICQGRDCGLITDQDRLYDNDDYHLHSYDQNKWEENVDVVMKTRVQESGSKICFSQEPVPSCPRHSYPVEYRKSKKVVFSCLGRDDSQVDDILRQIRRGQIPTEISTFTPSYSETELVPKECQRF